MTKRAPRRSALPAARTALRRRVPGRAGVRRPRRRRAAPSSPTRTRRSSPARWPRPRGKEREALAAYERAARLDSRGPEIWTRVGAVRCALRPRDPQADDAFARALAIDAALRRGLGGKGSVRRGSQRRRPERSTPRGARPSSIPRPTARTRSSRARAQTVHDAGHARRADRAHRDGARPRRGVGRARLVGVVARRRRALGARPRDAREDRARAARRGGACRRGARGGRGDWRGAFRRGRRSGGGRRPDGRGQVPAGAPASRSTRPLAVGDADVVRLRATRARVDARRSRARARCSRGTRDLAREIASAVTRADPDAMRGAARARGVRREGPGRRRLGGAAARRADVGRRVRRVRRARSVHAVSARGGARDARRGHARSPRRRGRPRRAAGRGAGLARARST